MRRAVVLLAVCSGGCLGALKHGVVDTIMVAADRPRPGRVFVRRGDETLRLLAGDFHCHVTPPDGRPHVVRELDATVELARREGLDFLVLTPHVRARTLHLPAVQRRLLDAMADVRAVRGGPVLIFGFEYTDFSYGHAGMAFGDLRRALTRASDDDPAAFVRTYLASGGIATINHPLLLPVETPIAVSTWDLSWRPLVEPARYPPDLELIDRRAATYEAYNLAIADLRDRFLFFDPERSIRRVLAAFDDKILRERRRLTPVGGSDTHGHHLRATTFVLATSNTRAAIAEGVRRGRTCVRAPEACRTMVRVDGGPWAIVGDARFGRAVEVRAPDGAQVLVNGEIVGARFAVDPKTCSIVRTRVGRGFSAPIYVNCAFAARRPRAGLLPTAVVPSPTP